MTIPKSKTMKHIIDLDGFTITVSEHPKPMMGGMNAHFIDYVQSHDCLDVHKIATCPIPGGFVYMYQLISIENGVSWFIVVNNKKYYDENGYFDLIMYDEFMESDNTLDAFIEFSKLMESQF